MGWIIVAFDLPTTTKEERVGAAKFRKFLLEDGYQMMQYSVYIRSMVTHSRMETHMRRLRKEVPADGSVRAIFVTESQWQRSYVVYGTDRRAKKPESQPEQMQFW